MDLKREARWGEGSLALKADVLTSKPSASLLRSVNLRPAPQRYMSVLASSLSMPNTVHVGHS